MRYSFLCSNPTEGVFNKYTNDLDNPKSKKPEKETKVPPLFYRKYPALREAIRSRNAIYNKQISLVEELEEQGKLIVLRPERPIVVDRMERNTQKLIDLYDEGYECASKIEFII